MSGGIGLLNEATIRIRFDVDDKEVKTIQSTFRALAKALNLENVANQFQVLDAALVETRGELGRVQAEMRDMRNEAVQAAQKSEAALQELSAAQTKLANSTKTMAANMANAYKRGVTAGQQMIATQRQMQQVQRDNEAKAKREVAALAALATSLNKSRDARAKEFAEAKKRQQLNLEEEAKREQIAQDRLNASRDRAAETAQRLAVYERILASVKGRGWEFEKKHAVLIEQVTNSRNADIKTLQRLEKQVLAVVNAQNRLNKAMSTGQFGEGQRMGIMEQVSLRISEAEKRVDALFRASYRLTMVGHTLRRFSQDIVRLGSEVMNTFGEFEFMLNRARGASQVFQGAMIEGHDGATLMREGVLDLAQELKVFPAAEVAQGLYFWTSTTGQAIETVNDLNVALDALNPAMKTAAMTNTSYEQTIKGVYSIITQYYNGALERADEVTVQLFETTQKTAAEFMDLIQSFKMVGPIAAQTGVQFEEVNEIFGRLADLGIRGTMAGRGLRQFFIQMVRPSGPAMKAIEKLWQSASPKHFGGKSFMETAFPEGEFVGIEQHVKNLAIATRELTSEERNRFLAQISTANMLPLLTALVAQERRELNGLTESNKNATTSTEQYMTALQRATVYFEKNWELLDQSWNALRGTVDRAVDAIRINIGAIVSDAIRPIIEWVTKMLDQFNLWVKNNPALVAAIGKMTAALAVGAGLAGAIFVVVGALTGLGAAVALVIDAFAPWLGTILKLTSTIGFFASALIENFEYIKHNAIQVLDNLNSAFGDTEDSIGSLGDMIRAVFEPAQTIMGAFVRAASDVAVRISELVVAFSKLDFAPELLNAIGMALGLFVAGRLVGGILSIGAAIAKLALNLVTLTGATKGLAGIKAVLSGLVGGPLGLAGLITAGGFLAYEMFPPFKEAVDNLADSFRNMDEEVRKTVSSMGDAGEALELTLIKMNVEAFDTTSLRRQEVQVSSQIDKVADQLARFPEEFQNKVREKMGVIESENIGLGGEGLTPDEMLTRLVEDNPETALWVELTRELRRLEAQDAQANGEIAQIIEDRSGWVDENLNIIKSYYAQFLKNINRLGMEIDSSDQTFYSAVNKIMAMGRSPEVAAQLASRVLSMPELMTPDKLKAEIEKQAMYTDLYGSGAVDELTQLPLTLLFDMLGGRIGAVNSSEMDAIAEKVASLYSIGDPTALGQALVKPLEGYAISVIDMLSEEQYREVWDDIERLQQHYAQLSTEWAEGMVPLDMIKARFTEALSMATEQNLTEFLPEFGKMSQAILEASVGAGGPDYAAMAKILKESVMPDGQKLVDAFLGGELPAGEAGLAMMEVVKMVAAETSDPQLQAWAEDTTAEAASETGEAAVKGIRRGLSEALSADRLSVESLIDMRKLGSTASQIRKAISWFSGKAAEMAMSGNFQMRIAGKDQAKDLIGPLIDQIGVWNSRGKEEKANRLFRDLRKGWPDIPPILRRLWREALVGAAEAGTLTEAQVQKILGPDWKLELPTPEIEFTPPTPQEINKIFGTTVKGIMPSPEELLAMMGQSPSGGGGAPESGVGQSVVDQLAASITNADKTPIKDAAKPVGNKAINTIVTQITGKESKVADAISETMSGASTSAAGRDLGAGIVANSWGNAVKSSLNNIDVSGNMRMVINTASFVTALSAGPAGRGIGETWGSGVVAGIRSKFDDISDAIGEAPKDGEPWHSPPKSGPL
jgi:TP901 family phage tail tape measure protein